MLLHGSSANLSNETRRSMCVHFASTTECKFLTNYPKNLDYVPKDFAKTVEKILATKFNTKEAKFIDGWHLKTRVICGNPGNFKMSQEYWKQWENNYFKGNRRPKWTYQQ